MPKVRASLLFFRCLAQSFARMFVCYSPLTSLYNEVVIWRLTQVQISESEAQWTLPFSPSIPYPRVQSKSIDLKYHFSSALPVYSPGQPPRFARVFWPFRLTCPICPLTAASARGSPAWHWAMLFRLLRKERADWALKPLAASPTQLQNQTSSFTPADFPGLGMSTRQALTEAEKSTSTTDITAGAPAYWFKHVQPHGGKVTSLAHYSKPHEVLLSVLWSIAEIDNLDFAPFPNFTNSTPNCHSRGSNQRS